MNYRSAFLVVFVVYSLAIFVSAQTHTSSQLEVQIYYTGKEKVDANHKLYVMLYESPKLIGTGKQPLAIVPANLTTRAAKFQDIRKSPVYILVAFSPQTVWHAEKIEEESPPGTVFTIYGANAPEAVSLVPGKTTNITVPLDDSKRVPPDRLTQLTALNDPTLPGSMVTHYTPGHIERARRLQSLLDGELNFYETQFNTRLEPVTLAVLDAGQWPKVAGSLPYGMPSMSYGKHGVFVMPARWEEVTWMPFPRQGDTDPTLLKKALGTGKSWRTLLNEGADGIGTHEIGHQIVFGLKITPMTHWQNELLASYIGYAYLQAKHPDEVQANELFWRAGLTGSHPYTSLADFEGKYQELSEKYPANYGWYQCALDQRVIEVYRQSGLDFVKQMQQAFPPNGPELDTNSVLDKLENLNPGWKAWAQQVGSGKIKVAE